MRRRVCIFLFLPSLPALLAVLPAKAKVYP